MTTLTGTAFKVTGTTIPLESAANGLVLDGSNLSSSPVAIQSSTTGSQTILNEGTSETFIEDTDGDGLFSDETQTTIATIDRYFITITFTDGSTYTPTGNSFLAVMTLSDGTQYLSIHDSAASVINNSSAAIMNITLNTFDNTYDGRVHQPNYTNSLNTRIICFCAGTKITTPNGERLVENLKTGDMVLDANCEERALLWIGSREVTVQEMNANIALQPVRIGAGSLGPNVPLNNVRMSRNHRIHVSSKIAKREFGDDGALVAAKHFLDIRGVNQETPNKSVTYIHLYVGEHSLLVSGGLVSESFYIGEQSLEMLTDASKASLAEVAPEINDPDYVMKPVCSIASGSEARDLIWRHMKNNKPFQEELTFPRGDAIKHEAV